MITQSPQDADLIAQLAKPLSGWADLTPKERASRRPQALWAPFQEARSAQRGGDFLAAIIPALSSGDIAFLHQQAILTLDLSAMLEIENSIPDGSEITVEAPYAETGLTPLPLLFSTELAERVCHDPAHPQRADFDALFDNLLSWSEDARWLDTPFLADPKESPDPKAVGARADWRPLHFAARLGRADLAERLLSAGAHPDGYLEAPSFEAEYGEQYPANDGGPLHLALKQLDIGLARLLLEAGADPNLGVVNEEETITSAERPIEIALGLRSTAALELLLERGAELLLAEPKALIPLQAPALINPRWRSDPFFWLRVRAQLSAEQAKNTAKTPAPGAAPARRSLFARLALGCYIALGRDPAAALQSAAQSPPPDSACPHWREAFGHLVAGSPGPFRRALALIDFHRPAPSNLAWLAFELCRASGESRLAPARLECLEFLAEAALANPLARELFLARQEHFAGLSFEAAAACLGGPETRLALGPLFDELVALNRPGGSALSALSLAALGAPVEDLEAVLASWRAAGLPHPRLSPKDPGPLAIALGAWRFEAADAIAKAWGADLPPEALAAARDHEPEPEPSDPRRLAILEWCSLRSDSSNKTNPPFARAVLAGPSPRPDSIASRKNPPPRL